MTAVRRNAILRFTVLSLMASVLCSCGGPSADCDRLESLGQCSRNFKDVHGLFPPPVVLDKNGRRMHSWRVLLLPYIEANAFYENYDFDAAWDGPANADLADGSRHNEGAKFSEPADVRTFYQPHLSSLSSEDFTTDYLMVLRGDERLVPSKAPTRRPEGNEWQVPAASDEVLIVQVKKSQVHWMEPRDVVLTSPAPKWGIPLDEISDDILGSVLVSGGRVICHDRDATLRLLAERTSNIHAAAREGPNTPR